MRITFLTPNLPPIVCGLSDHSRLLGAALKDQGCEVSFVGRRGDRGAVDPGSWPGRVQWWDGRSEALADLLRADAAHWMWLQLSGYGYSRWGAPWELARAVRRSKRCLPKLRVAVCVHEVHCEPEQLGSKGRILSRWQRHVLGSLVLLGDAVFPTIPLWRERCLRDYGVEEDKITLLPIAANVPARRLDAEERARFRSGLSWGAAERIAVTFGQWTSQTTALERFRNCLQRALARSEVDRIVAVGGESASRHAALAREWQRSWGRSLTVMGPQPAEVVALVLASCDVGLVPTPFRFWQKSGAARAMEQAGLELWIYDEGDLRIVQPVKETPTWPELARVAKDVLSRHAPEGSRQAEEPSYRVE